MMRALIFALATLVATTPVATLAQEAAAPTPTPDPMVYEDAAMHFQAPAGYLSVGQRQVRVADLNGDGPTPVAGWVYPSKDHPRRLLIQMESYDGTDVSGFEGVFEDQLRQKLDSPLFKNKEHLSLKNGMPAMLVQVTSGSGFDEIKFFLLEWVDGVRGVVIMVSSQIDDIDEAKAKLLLSDVSAVAYPLGR